MSRGALVRLLLVIGLLGGCVALALTQEPRLGLDLRGGTQITLQASDSPSGVKADAEATDRAIEVLRGRVDALGISEPRSPAPARTASSSAPRRAGPAPGRRDHRPDGAAGPCTPSSRAASPRPTPAVRGGRNQVLPSDQGDFIEVGPARLEGDDITGAEAVQRDNTAAWTVAVDFSGDGSRAFGSSPRPPPARRATPTR